MNNETNQDRDDHDHGQSNREDTQQPQQQDQLRHSLDDITRSRRRSLIDYNEANYIDNTLPEQQEEQEIEEQENQQRPQQQTPQSQAQLRRSLDNMIRSRRSSAIDYNEANYIDNTLPGQQEEQEIQPPPQPTPPVQPEPYGVIAVVPLTTISQPLAKPAHPFLIQVWIDIAYLILFSYAGFAARFGLEEVYSSTTGINGQHLRFSIFPDFYANVVGCFAMALFAEFNAEVLIPRKHVRASNLVSVGLMTGFCGCVTTFSGWQYDSMFALVLGQVGTFFLYQVLGFCVSYCALSLGHDLCCLLFIPAYKFLRVVAHPNEGKSPVFPTTLSEKDSISPKFLRLEVQFTILWRVIVVLVLVTDLLLTCLFIALVSSPISTSARSIAASFLLCPFGCVFRYFFSLLNARLVPKIPIFTFCANLLGTLIVPFFRVTEFRYASVQNREALVVFFLAMSRGFCGCLTTVSSFLEEVRTKVTNLRWKYFYILLTLIVPNLVLVAVVGPFVWTM